MIALLPGGLSLSYDEMGSGMPLLFVHGWPHDHTLWSGQLTCLSTRARCIAPDLRGFGGSSVQGPYSMEQYADDLAAFLDHLGLDQVVVCGLSMGGYVAMAMLRRHPRRVRALILADTRATADTDEGREKRARLVAFVEAHGVPALAVRQLKAMVAATTLSSRPELCQSLVQLMSAAPLEGVVGALRAMAARPSSVELLSRVEVPVLVIGGAEDSFTPPNELRAMAAGIPGSRFELLEGGGHVSPFERPAAFNHVVAEFLESLVAS